MGKETVRYQNLETEDIDLILNTLFENAKYIINNITYPLRNSKYGVSYIVDKSKKNIFVGADSKSNNGNIIFEYQNDMDICFQDILKKNARKNLCKRWIESIMKLAAQLENSLENLYSDDDAMELIDYISFDFSKLFKDSKAFNFDNFIIVEGFIMEGKTHFLKSNDLLDNEMDIFFRKPLKDGRDMPEIYYPIFYLLGFLRALNQQALFQTLTIIRGWGSMSLFPKICPSKDSSSWSNLPKEHISFQRSFYENLFTCLKACNNKDREISSKFKIEIKVMTNNEVPKPFLEHRDMEKKIYQNSNIDAIALKFYLNLIAIYSEVSDKSLKRKLDD
jgi:hypothetical protein